MQRKMSPIMAHSIADTLGVPRKKVEEAWEKLPLEFRITNYHNEYIVRKAIEEKLNEE